MKLIVSTMKNEAPFLLEWIAYHQAIGFDYFLIFTNDCTDGTDYLLDRLTELGVVKHRRNKVLRRGPHKSALKYAFEDPLMAEADWVYVTDVDEFLNIQAGDGMVDDLIATYPEADAIPITWRMFASNGNIDFPEGLTIQSSTDAEQDTPRSRRDLRFVKSMFRTDKRIAKLGLHAPHYKEEHRDEINWGSRYIEANPEGEPRRPNNVYGYDVAQVNHYAVRSVDAYLLKRDRGRANHVSETLDDSYWLRWNLGGTEDTTVLRHLDETQRNLDVLRADPKVAFLEDAGLAMNQVRLAELKQNPDFAALRGKLIPAPPVPAAPDANSMVQMANAGMKQKSPRRHENRQDVLNMMPKAGRCAEIGVWQGGFSVEILNITQPKELVLIDPWGLIAQSDEADWTHGKHEHAEEMDAMYDGIVAEFDDAPNVTIRKGFSADVLSDFPDGYFDWVYIDGNHLYDFVKEDIEISYRKVRDGGVIAGDDFHWKRDGRRHVKEAVMDALTGLGLDPAAHLSRKGQQFMIKVGN